MIKSFSNTILALLLSLGYSPSLCYAQNIDSLSQNFSSFGGIIYLDSLTVTASRQGFNVDDFILMVQSDRSFYQAFHNLRKHSYQSDNEIIMYDKKGRQKAYYQNKVQQESDGDCRTMDFIEEHSAGNFFKRKRKLRYYTAKMHDRIFQTHGRICESNRVTASHPSGIEKHIRELKKLIFAPGQAVDVPIIGDRMAIFEPKMSRYYEYTIRSGKYNKTECYIFTARVKPEYRERKEHKTVVKYLETYFDKNQFQVVARDYRVKYEGALFSFDVHMQIELDLWDSSYLPKRIKYDGYWDVPAKKPETAEFTIQFYNFDRN
ncbi:MAG: hypothetical protein AAFP19_10265 [Bacteroidota bacterium]